MVALLKYFIEGSSRKSSTSVTDVREDTGAPHPPRTWVIGVGWCGGVCDARHESLANHKWVRM